MLNKKGGFLMKTEKNFKEVNHNETTLPYEAKTNINIVINDYWQ